ncbi:hypothetical protein [Streptosporangium sp. H16]|uniref:hypothetical protein n=1 Tax=Streptosporangium sp. H16 TaxID=3444184 RepID=UPI003F7A9CAD
MTDEPMNSAIGEGTEIRPPLRVDYGGHIRIGARTRGNVIGKPMIAAGVPSAHWIRRSFRALYQM